jgi:hypothetical protein
MSENNKAIYCKKNSHCKPKTQDVIGLEIFPYITCNRDNFFNPKD